MKDMSDQNLCGSQASTFVEGGVRYVRNVNFFWTEYLCECIFIVERERERTSQVRSRSSLRDGKNAKNENENETSISFKQD